MLTSTKNVHKRSGRQVSHPVAAATVIHGGAAVVLDGGFAKPATTAVGLVAAGMADQSVDNSDGANGDVSVTVSRDDWFRLMNDVGDPVTRSSLNQPCYFVDDETVAATDNGGARSVAGVVRDIDDAGVWLEFQ